MKKSHQILKIIFTILWVRVKRKYCITADCYFVASETLTEEEKKVEIEKINALREAERVEALRRKQMESYTKMRREMRRRQQQQLLAASSGNAVEVKTSAMTFEPLDPKTSEVSTSFIFLDCCYIFAGGSCYQTTYFYCA